jgi:hypothetical protein
VLDEESPADKPISVRHCRQRHPTASLVGTANTGGNAAHQQFSPGLQSMAVLQREQQVSMANSMRVLRTHS